MNADQVIAHATVLKDELDSALARSIADVAPTRAARRAVTIARKRLITFLEVMSQGGIEPPFDTSSLPQ